MHLGLCSVLTRNEFDSAVVVNGRVKARAFSVDCDLRERAHCTGEAAPFAVHGNHQSHAGASVVFSQADAGSEQGIGDVELAEVEEAVLNVVDPDGEEVQCVDGGNLENAERRDRIGRVELGG